MNTIKTAVVVASLLAVLYGVYHVLNQPEAVAPPGLAWEDEGSNELLVGGSDFTDPLTAFASTDSTFEMAQPPSPNLEGEHALHEGHSHLGQGEGPFVPEQGNTQDGISPAPGGSPNYDTSLPPYDSPQGSFEDGASNSEAGYALPPIPPRGDSQNSDILTASNLNPSGGVRLAGAPEFESTLKTAKTQIENNQWSDALVTLSAYYGKIELTREENEHLLDLLDPLAAKVIYSKEHLLARPHEVQRGESLEDIAHQYNVPWQLLKNINEIDNPALIRPGMLLKVVPGPFRAEVSISKNELSLFLGNMYAGRFPLTIGSDPLPQPGRYTVHDKQSGHNYYSGDGRLIKAGHPNNPYGRYWLDLGGDVCIHGSAKIPQVNQGGPGCISLSPIDASDVYSIVSKGSEIRIRR